MRLFSVHVIASSKVVQYLDSAASTRLYRGLVLSMSVLTQMEIHICSADSGLSLSPMLTVRVRNVCLEVWNRILVGIQLKACNT